MMIFDTDVLIWFQRGNLHAAQKIGGTRERYISIQTYMELLQCAKNKKMHKIVKQFLRDFDFTVLPLSENIGHRASVYIEEYSLSHDLRSGDSLIAATAVENKLPLMSGNKKHFQFIKELDLHIFKA